MLQQQLEALANGDGFRNEISNAPGTTAFVATIGAGYGCWCFWGDDHTKRAAKGPPLDELDAFCHTLSRGYECVTYDIDGCSPWDIDYLPSEDLSVVGPTPADVKAECEVRNPAEAPDSCVVSACTVESWFLKQIQLVTGSSITPAMINTDYKHNSAGWSGAGGRQFELCRGPEAGTDRQLECCGVYPERFPYNALAQNKVCCEATDGTLGSSAAQPVQTYIYNTAFEQCCDDGTIITFGETC